MTAMRTTDEAIAAMVGNDDNTSIVRPEVGALEAITRSEVAMQLDSAHRYPRTPTKFLREALSLATFSVEVAESCIYTVPRAGSNISGPSVRLAEMCASAWGNLHVGARVIDIGEREVTAQAVAWDLEKNVRVTVEAQRSIWGKNGRFGDDMIRVTGMAAISIALRNAIFRVIPRAYVDAVYQKAILVAAGSAETLVARRAEVMARLTGLGLTPERIFLRLGIAGIADINLDHMTTLIGLGTAIKSGEVKLDEAFPVAAPAPVPEGTPEGKRIKMTGKGKATEATKPVAVKPAPAAKPVQAVADIPISGPDKVDDQELHETLAEATDEWTIPGDEARRILASWTPSMRGAALRWAQAVAHDGPMHVQADRPAHTILGRQPGDD
jgi:hypothetical protein